MAFEKETNHILDLARYIITGMFLIAIIALVAKALAETLFGAGLGWIGAVIGGIGTTAVYFFNKKIRSKLH